MGEASQTSTALNEATVREEEKQKKSIFSFNSFSEEKESRPQWIEKAYKAKNAEIFEFQIPHVIWALFVISINKQNNESIAEHLTIKTLLINS